jgi:N-acetylneuraminic acid mutarotase
LNDDSIASVERYDPNLSFWTPVTSMHEARSNHFFIRCGNYLYAIGGKATGLSIDGQITCLNSVERYNVVSNKWDRVAPMNKERFDFAAVVMNNEIYVFGGKVLLEYNHVTKTRATPRAEKFDPATNTWLELPKMNQSRSSPSVIIVNSKCYVPTPGLD